MNLPSLQQEIMTLLPNLSDSDQKKVLHLTRQLAHTKGIVGEEFFQKAQSIQFAAQDLAEIEQIIEQGCEAVDEQGW